MHEKDLEVSHDCPKSRANEFMLCALKQMSFFVKFKLTIYFQLVLRTGLFAAELTIKVVKQVRDIISELKSSFSEANKYFDFLGAQDYVQVLSR